MWVQSRQCLPLRFLSSPVGFSQHGKIGSTSASVGVRAQTLYRFCGILEKSGSWPLWARTMGGRFLSVRRDLVGFGDHATRGD